MVRQKVESANQNAILFQINIRNLAEIETSSPNQASGY